MPLLSSDDEETEVAKPAVPVATVASRLTARKPETKPAAVATAPNAQAAFALASASSTPFTLGSAPRRTAAPERATATEAAGAVQSWLSDIDQRPSAAANDRVAPETALAYAAAAAPDPRAEQPRRTASLFNPAPPARESAPAMTQVPKSPGKPAPVKVGQRYNDPWMRSITLSASLHYSAVTVYGPFDARGVQTMIAKPETSLVMSFGNEPYEGLTTVRFDGPAISFLPVMPFRERLASLR
jgi:hypothetical protein